MAARPDHLIVRPNPQVTALMDPLSEVLRSVRLKGGIFLDARFTAPWSVVSKIDTAICAPFLMAPTHIIAYHFIIDGQLLITIEGEPTMEVCAGEVVLLPRNDTHRMASAIGLTPVSAHDLIHPSADRGLARISHGGGGQTTHLVCGFLSSEELF